jgi:hypothetical protein
VKIHAKKKETRALWKQFAKEGRMPDASGQWRNRASAADNAMKRDFSPQGR